MPHSPPLSSYHFDIKNPGESYSTGFQFHDGLFRRFNCSGKISVTTATVANALAEISSFVFSQTQVEFPPLRPRWPARDHLSNLSRVRHASNFHKPNSYPQSLQTKVGEQARVAAKTSTGVSLGLTPLARLLVKPAPDESIYTQKAWQRTQARYERRQH